jgi:hypothetical protein
LTFMAPALCVCGLRNPRDFALMRSLNRHKPPVRAISFSPMYVSAILCLLLLCAGIAGQTPQRVDFARDVRPMFQENCIGCHAPDRVLQLSSDN